MNARIECKNGSTGHTKKILWGALHVVGVGVGVAAAISSKSFASTNAAPKKISKTNLVHILVES